MFKWGKDEPFDTCLSWFSSRINAIGETILFTSFTWSIPQSVKSSLQSEKNQTDGEDQKGYG